MKITDLVIGAKFEMEVFDRLGEMVIPPFPTKLEAILDENKIVVNAPIFKGNIFPVHTGWSVNVYFTHKKDLYYFPAIIVGRGKKDDMPLMEIKVTDNISKIQRRHYFRLNISLPVRYREFDPLLKEDDEQHEYIESTTIDISGGGISIVTDEKLENDNLIECKIILPDNKDIPFIGKIIRSEKLFDVNPEKYRNAIKFIAIENKNKESLIRHIHNEQIKLIRKGFLTND